VGDEPTLEFAMEIPDRPRDIIWDITYACPLRCTHCYSESGRRPSRQLGSPDLLRVADALLTLEPQAVVLAGGEPLLVRGVFEVAERLSAAGVQVLAYTGGWSMRPDTAMRLAQTISHVSVSVDGATPTVHDRVRGRAGSFDHAMTTLAVLDQTAGAARRSGAAPLRFGIDCTVTRGCLPQLEDFCTRIAPRFAELSSLSFGAAMPIGLASRKEYLCELLTDSEADRLCSPETVTRLQRLAPASVHVSVTDNRLLQMHPDLVARGIFPTMQVEPDGAVRAMAIYEGTVGNVLTEPPQELWQRAVERWADPFVVETLTPVRTMAQWADATRRIDHRFGSDADRLRIENRPLHAALS